MTWDNVISGIILFYVKLSIVAGIFYFSKFSVKEVFKIHSGFVEARVFGYIYCVVFSGLLTLGYIIERDSHFYLKRFVLFFGIVLIAGLVGMYSGFKKEKINEKTAS